VPNLPISITPLGHTHDRGAFSCGQKFIDRYFEQKCLEDHDVHKVRVYVATEPESNLALGFYTLSLTALKAEETTPEDAQAKYGRWAIPLVYLGQIGVRKEYQKKNGIGSGLMLHAFERTLEIANLAGTYGLALDAVDEEVAQWYEDLAFERYDTEADGRVKMICHLNTIRQALAD
jgi:hypothetical protein